MSGVRGLLLSLFVIVLGGAVAYFGGFIAQPAPPAPASAAATAVPDAMDGTGLDQAAEESRRLSMQVAYADLEKARLLLNQQLASLNAVLWDRRLPAARAHAIQNDMMSARNLLTNPPLLGAFRDAAGIQHERERVAAARSRLQAVEDELRSGGG